MDHPVYNEVMEAYYDCHSGARWDTCNKRRNLSFRASQPVDRAMAIDILSDALHRGYNEFEPSLLEQLPEDSKIILAREGSVCIYVEGEIPADIVPKLKCDECDYDGKETRIWWD